MSGSRNGSSSSPLTKLTVPLQMPLSAWPGPPSRGFQISRVGAALGDWGDARGWGKLDASRIACSTRCDPSSEAR